MTIEFMVEDTAYYNSDMPYTITESYYPDEYPYHGYDIYRVETDKPSDIRVIFGNGYEYEAEQVIPFKEGNNTVYVVSIWNPVEGVKEL